ncbi:MAG: hypothetical protein ACOY4P_00825 [Pseudomonadota bacterium]
MDLTLVIRNAFPLDGDFVKPIVREQSLAEAVDFVRVVGQTLVLTVLSDGMRRLAEHSGIPLSRMLFFGDAIYPGGNDDPVRSSGIDAIAVRDVAETKTALAALLACMGSR